jgi:hypothetical protein
MLIAECRYLICPKPEIQKKLLECKQVKVYVKAITVKPKSDGHP